MADTAEQKYQVAKAWLASNKESPEYARVKAKVSEYERYNPSHNAPSEGLHAQNGEELAPLESAPAKAPIVAGSHVSDPSLAASIERRQADPWATPEALPDVEDQDKDPMLQTASKLKALARPTEVVGSRLEGLKHIAAATIRKGGLLDGALANSYYEPSAEQFMRDQAALLKARNIQPGTPGFQEYFDEYKDRKWAQAHDAAQAEGRPLTRMEFVKRDHLGWDKLSDMLANGIDTTGGFVKGLVAGRTLQASKLVNPIKDKLFGTDQAADDRAQADRNSNANFAGELTGAVKGPLGEVTEGAAPWQGSKSLGARIGGAAISGAVGGLGDASSRVAEASIGDAISGNDTGRAAEAGSTGHLIGSALMGAGFGAGGHLAAEGLNAAQKAVLADAPELGQLRRGGGDTSILRGISPGKAVAENIEAAREPLPGEAKAMPTGSPVEIAAEKVRAPLAQAHTDLNQKTFERLGAEKQAAVEAAPELRSPVSARRTAQAVSDWIRSKLQPDAPGFIPGMKLKTPDIAPGGDLGEASKLATQIYKPRLVTAVEAKAAAERNGGFVVSVDEAKKLGFRVKALDDTGIPVGAPPVEASAPIDEGTVSVPKLLPKYPKGTDAGGVAADITPEEADAIRRYTWGKREPGDADKVNNYLERAPVSPLPHVYRGLAMKPDEAADMLTSGQFSTGSEPTSVSFDPTVARSFAARNRQPGDVGVTLKLEHASARNISGLAHDQVGVEKELILPARRNFEIVSKHQDPANPGDWIVVARETDAPATAGSSVKDVFGTAPDKVEPSPVDRLKPRLGRAKPPPAPTPGSDWERPAFERGKFDFIYHDHATPDPFAPPAGDDVTPTRPSNSPPIIERRAVSRGAPSSAPPELRAQPSPQAATAQASPASATEAPEASGEDWLERTALVPSPSEQAAAALKASVKKKDAFRVVLEPRDYNALKFEDVLGDIDRKAGYAKASGAPDPQWEKLAQAIREDREQFGSGWTDLIAKHHDELNRLEQRSFHAGLAEDKAYPEMRGGSQQRLQGKLKGFPGDSDSNRALREIAASAPPEVQRDLEVLGAQNAYTKLKGQANPKLGESLGPSGVVGHLRGLGPAVKFRADALARGLSAGPTGQPTITPRLAQFVREQVPSPSWIPGLGGGALGLKAAVAYDALTPQQQAFLDKLVATVRPNEQAGVSQ